VAARQLIGTIQGSGSFRLPGVPVLLYHGIRENATGSVPSVEEKYYVTRELFREQLSLIRNLGLRVVGLPEIIERSLPSGQPAVAITFDDGLLSDYRYALPLLQEAGVTAHFFISTARVGTPRYMDWTEIDALHKAGMQIGSHGHHHADLSLPTLSVLIEELTRSRSLLEGRLDAPVLLFSAPYGLTSRRLFFAAEQSGFRGICTSRCWPAKPGVSWIARVPVYASTTITEFRALLEGQALTYFRRNLRAGSVYFPRKVLLRLNPKALGVNVLKELQ
jgi:peptidoglycan/xylan/chitin deacetylase (PgdA/CDA1 family)